MHFKLAVGALMKLIEAWGHGNTITFLALLIEA